MAFVRAVSADCVYLSCEREAVYWFVSLYDKWPLLGPNMLRLMKTDYEVLSCERGAVFCFLSLKP